MPYIDYEIPGGNITQVLGAIQGAPWTDPWNLVDNPHPTVFVIATVGTDQHLFAHSYGRNGFAWTDLGKPGDLGGFQLGLGGYGTTTDDLECAFVPTSNGDLYLADDFQIDGPSGFANWVYLGPGPHPPFGGTR